MTGQVIALSGPPGAGKTTIGRWLTGQLNATRVNYDDHEQMTRRSETDVADWLSRGAPIDEIPAPGLVEAVDLARQTNTVVYETPLGKAWAPTRDMISLSIWIETPLDLALSRKMQIMAQAWQDKGGPAEPCAQWFKGHFRAYEEIIRPSLLVQIERVRSKSDVIVHNNKAINETQAQILAVLASLQK
jgi:uridine kinase